MRDVIIVGGGPAGCFVGKKLAEKDFQVTILEEHGVIGQPMCCAGILGAERLKEVGLNPADWSVNELKEGVFHSPSGERVNMTRDQTEAHVIERSEFDRDLAKQAGRAGAEIRLNTRCVGLSRHDEGVSVKVKNRGYESELEGRMIIGADGTNSLVARKFGLIDGVSPIIGAQAEIVGVPNSHKAHVFLTNELSQDFFGWVVPTGEVYRVGLGVKEENVMRKLLKFIEENPVLPPRSLRKMTSFSVGLIPKAGTRKIWDDRVLLVGDAAGHVKPLTGGGLYLGLSCADIAADVAAEALERGDLGGILENYSERVDDKFGQEFELGNRALDIFQNMSNEDISEFLKVLERPEVRDLILENAAFDRHSTLLKTLLEKGPSILSTLGFRKLLKYLKWLR